MRGVLFPSAVIAAALMLTGCSTADDHPPSQPPQSSTDPAQDPSPSTATAKLSKPLGSWQLAAGIPAGTPTDLPFPKDRWIADSSVAFDNEGGMIDLWVTNVEFEQVLLDFKDAGWEFGERSESSGRTNIVGYRDGQTRAVNIMYTAENTDRDARLTVTYVASLP